VPRYDTKGNEKGTQILPAWKEIPSKKGAIEIKKALAALLKYPELSLPEALAQELKNEEEGKTKIDPTA